MAGIRFQCPNCKSQRTANARMVGRSIRCPDCDTMITIPKPDEPIPVVSLLTASEPLAGRKVASAWTEEKPLDASDKPRQTWADPVESVGEPDTRGQRNIQVEDEEPEQVSLGDRLPMDEEMDMTPMVDVTFLLLIFFMVTASFASEKVIQQKTAKKDASSSPVVEVVDTLTVRIDDLNTYLVIMPDQSEIDASNKQDLLIALGDARKEGLLDDVENVKVEAHEESIHAALVAALDACRTEGLANFQVKVVEAFD